MDEAGAEGASCTSSLSVAELALLREAGFRPLGMVMGTCVYSIGYQWSASLSAFGGMGGLGFGQWSAPYYLEEFPCPHLYYHEGSRSGYNFEHYVYSEGFDEAANLALSRLRDEAAARGAHGVAGVRLEIANRAASGEYLELKLLGTALGLAGLAPPPVPFTSWLSGQELIKLLAAGYFPLSLVMVARIVEAVAGCETEQVAFAYQNVEVRQHTRASEATRALVAKALEKAAPAEADALVGVKLERKVHHLAGERILVEMTAVANAVRQLPERPSLAIVPMMRLNDL
jgi:uncharacterized protein YbjQ (UPF0145 family)